MVSSCNSVSSTTMAEQSLSTTSLPVLPLPGAVAFPGTVVTITLETPDAQAAAMAAVELSGKLLLLPQIDGRTTTIGVIGSIEQSAELPNGSRVVIVRTHQRAVVVGEVTSERSGRWMTVEPLNEARTSPRVAAWGRVM